MVAKYRGSCTVLLNVKVRSYYMSMLEAACKGYNSLTKHGITEFMASKPVKDKCYDKLNELKKKINVDLDLIKPLIDSEGKAGSYRVLRDENIELKDENAKLKAAILALETEKEVLTRTNEKLSNSSSVTDKVEEVMNKWKLDLDQDLINISVKKEVKETVKENLKDIMTDAFNTIVSTDKMKKTFADVVKNSQNVIQKETEKCFKKSLTTALQESQEEIVAKTSARQEADLFDKERRARNVVMTYVQESTLTEIEDKKESDKEMAKELLQIGGNKIEKCYRVGRPQESDNRDRKGPRPLVVVLETLELAKSLHKYGNGCKLSQDGEEYWVNPDLTKAERRAQG